MKVSEIIVGGKVMCGRREATVIKVKPGADIDVVVDIDGRLYDAFSEDLSPIFTNNKV